MDRERENAAWLARWDEGRIGFHSDDINPHLVRYWPSLHVSEGTPVLVPLAGKSRDMLWLAEQGHAVIGSELSQTAVAAFFDEAGLRPVRATSGAFEIWSSGRIRILCGDFFALDTGLTGRIGACYDRAALVALPEQLRQRYVHHLARLLPPGVETLLIGVSYAQEQMDGPPYSVTEAEIRRLASGRFEIELLAPGSDMLADNPRFAERGLTWMEEAVYRLRRLGDDRSVGGSGDRTG